MFLNGFITLKVSIGDIDIIVIRRVFRLYIFRLGGSYISVWYIFILKLCIYIL